MLRTLRKLKIALNILFFVLKHVLVSASNYYNSLSVNYSYLNGSIKMTADSTFGGGVNAFLSTLKSNLCVVVKSLVFIESLEYASCPGSATSDYANSNWNMRTNFLIYGFY